MCSSSLIALFVRFCVSWRWM